MVERSYLQDTACSLSLTIIIILLTILGCYEKIVIGSMLTLSPMSEALVCHVGDPLQLTCTASVQFIRWGIVVINDQGMEEEITVSRNSRDSSPPPRERIINSTKFTITRVSGVGDLPLISTLDINSTSISLNGTVVHCRDADNPVISVSSTIHITDGTNNNLYSPKLEIISEQLNFDDNNVTVTVKWIEESAVNYATRILPSAIEIMSNSQQAQLILLYNTSYNFSVEAYARCRQNATGFIEIYYDICGDPESFLLTINDSLLNIEDYDGPPVPNTMITFTCPPGFMVVGPNSATCTENGEWEPKFGDVTCSNTTDNNLMNSNGNSAILIGSISAVIILTCIGVTAVLVVVTYVVHRKGRTVKPSYASQTKGKGGGNSNAKHSSSHKVLYQKKSSLWIDNNNQNPQEDLVYADVTVATKSNRMRTIPDRPTISSAEPELNVEYSAINFKLCNKKSVMEQHPSHVISDDSLDVTLDKLLALLREQVGPRWYDFGEAVGIDEVVLDSIAKTTFPENCIVEVLEYWLKYFDDGTLTWSDVATALRDINLQELAYHIEQVYGVEADTSDLLQESVPSMVTPSSQTLPSAPLKGPEIHIL